MNHQEGLTLFELILPICVGLALGSFALIGMQELLHEFSVAFKGGFE
ncbi:hypothetical protein [Prochlorococcus sp. MIT 1300]|nr:hypothetical protein [Prochlorococcus sp. MIT 1300]